MGPYWRSGGWPASSQGGEGSAPIVHMWSEVCPSAGMDLLQRNYGCDGDRGSWEVEHSVARARGGTDRLNNLYAACISCNRSKQAMTTRAFRARNGVRRAPLSKKRHDVARVSNTISGAVLGTVAAAIFAREIWLLGTILGAALGHEIDPDN